MHPQGRLTGKHAADVKASKDPAHASVGGPNYAEARNRGSEGRSGSWEAALGMCLTGLISQDS